MQQSKALFAGSFDPFTYGHWDIINQAAPLFQKLYVCVAVNANKTRFTNAEEMRKAIASFLSAYYPNVEVICHNGLIAKFCAEQDIKYLIRGLRSTSDYLYEENIAKINKELNPELKQIYFRANNDTISSSMVRELFAHNCDVAPYVPHSVHSLLTK